VFAHFLLTKVNDMNLKPLIPVLLLSVLSGCAATAGNDPVRARVLAELEQAKKDGSLPLTEAQYVYPNWVTPHNAP
jgi:hypothetical protein